MPVTPPSHATEMILVRHGETVWNRQGRWQGHLDSELTELGLRQAAGIADRLRERALAICGGSFYITVLRSIGAASQPPSGGQDARPPLAGA